MARATPVEPLSRSARARPMQGVPSAAAASLVTVVRPCPPLRADNATEEGGIDAAALLSTLEAACGSTTSDGGRALLLIDDAGTLLDACTDVAAGARLLARLLCLGDAPHALAADARPTTRPALVALRLPAGCRWSVARGAAFAPVSLGGLLRGLADCVCTVAPLPSGFSRDVHGRVTARWPPPVVGAAPAAAAAAAAAGGGTGTAWARPPPRSMLYRVAEGGLRGVGDVAVAAQ